MASEATPTIIGRFCTVHGEITGEGDVRIDGTLEGSVHLTGARITVGPEAKVKAQLSAQDVIIAGAVEGEVRATGRAELRSTASLVGNVYASRFSMEDDATVRGHIDLNQPAEKMPALTPETPAAAQPSNDMADSKS
jgi:cytoskeletal protein CcmA (bactofilin family)